MSEWRFYGRQPELDELTGMLRRNRWFFAKITGRRRIGKTTLIQNALREASANARPLLYVQVPDSGEAGVLSAVADAMDTFAIAPDRFPRPRTLADLAKTIESLALAGQIVILDEFQYFHRAPLSEFCSFLQGAVDRLSAQPHQVPGGLIVLGSIHTEMAALLEDRLAPLFNRTTDILELRHLDIASVMAILREHTDATPERLLFLWTLFEGVPKFYRDAWEQAVLASERETVLQRLFFDSSSPLRTEADNWFLRELRGRYDTVLKLVARHPGSSHGELVEAIRQAGGETTGQIGGYLQTLSDRYRLIESKLPVFAAATARRRRYYLSDNFLEAWLAAIATSVAAREFRPLPQLVKEADARLQVVEGSALEKLVGRLYEERSRKAVGDFPLTDRIRGYWDRSDTEIDLVAINEPEQRLRLGSCKRSPGKLLSDIPNFCGHVERFLATFSQYRSWRIERVGIAPRLSADERAVLERHEVIPQDLNDLTAGLEGTTSFTAQPPAPASQD